MGNLFRVVLLFALPLLILAGCGNKPYKVAMEAGQEAIEDEALEKAVTLFKEALENKPDDSTATRYLAQIEYMIEGLRALEDGELDEAENALKAAEKIEDGLSNLVERVSAILDEIALLKKQYAEVEKLIAEVQKEEAEGNYDEALSKLVQIEKLALNHSYFNTMKEEVSTLEQVIKEKNGREQAAQQAYEEAKQLMNEKDYDGALAVIEETLKEELATPAWKSLQEDLEALKKEVHRNKLAIEKEQKKQSLIAAVQQGYWVHPEQDNFYCSFKKDHYVCAADGSDVFVFKEVERWDANPDKGEVIIYQKDGTSWSVSISNGLLVLGDGNYKRISKETLINEVGFTAEGVDDFFDPEVYRQYIHH